MKFKIVLSEQGKRIYLGGNVEVMKQCLKTFEAKNERVAEGIMHRLVTTTMGSASIDLYELQKVKA